MATKPNMAPITQVRNRCPTLMWKNLYAASVPATAAIVPSTAPITSPPGSPPLLKIDSMALLKAPTKTPSKAA